MKLKTILPTLILIGLISFASQARNDANTYADHLKSSAVDPIDYLLSKLKDYRIVAIGEDHWIADHTPFFCDVLRKAAEKKETRPDIVALEFGSELDQATANRVAYSPTFMPDSVIKILQHAPDVLGNPYKEYFDVFKCIWEINRTLPEEEKIAIRLLDPAGVQDSFKQTSLQRSKDRDMSMFEKMRWDFMRGNKIVFYAGQAHTQHQIRGYKPNNGKNYYNYPSAGFLIKAVYPNEVFTIDLWAPLNMGSGYERNPQTGNWIERNSGLYDKAFAINGNKPCGFDIAGSPWGEITMAEYFCPPGKEDFYVSRPNDANPYTKDIRLSQLIDGIVFIKPSKDFTGGHLIDIYTPDFVEICRQRFNGRLTTPADMLRQVRKWRPQMVMPD